MDQKEETGIGSRKQLDTTFGLYSLDARGPHEHKVPEHGGCTEPTRWVRNTGCAAGGEEGAVAPCMFPETGTWSCVEGPGIFRSERLRELRRAHCPPQHMHTNGLSSYNNGIHRRVQILVKEAKEALHTM